MSFLYLFLMGSVFNVVYSAMPASAAFLAEEQSLDFKGVAARYGSEAVAHEVETSDGYVLKMFNIPGDKRKIVVFLHGVFDSSDGFIISGNDSLVMMAVHAGYDVWMGNFRGNRYSRRHKSLDPDKDAKFWDYSAHHYGVYDVPTFIDYVLNYTGQKRLSIIGFSEGTTAAFILGSSLPEYNDKVKIFIALAPVVFLDHVRPALSTIIKWSPVIDFFLPQSVQEVAGFHSTSKSIMNFICTQLPTSYELCYQKGMNSVSGDDPDGIDREFLKVIVEHFPAGTSRRNLMHFAQMSLRSKFAQFDYGASKNWNFYNASEPPEYNVTKVTMNTLLVSGLNDPVSTMLDVDVLMKQLPNVVKHIVIKDPQYNHLDHLWAKHARELEYEQVMDELAKYCI